MKRLFALIVLVACAAFGIWIVRLRSMTPPHPPETGRSLSVGSPNKFYQAQLTYSISTSSLPEKRLYELLVWRREEFPGDTSGTNFFVYRLRTAALGTRTPELVTERAVDWSPDSSYVTFRLGYTSVVVQVDGIVSGM